MPPVLIKELGPGTDPTANSYADLNDGNTYCAARLNAGIWTAATDGDKTIALIMATKLIDRLYQFNGARLSMVQPLQWPRMNVVDPDSTDTFLPLMARRSGFYFADNATPRLVIDATCELALNLLTQDRMGDPDGIGITHFRLVGAVEVTFDKRDKLPVIPTLVQMMLSKVGIYMGAGGAAVQLRRT